MNTNNQSAGSAGSLKIEQVFVPENIDIRLAEQMQVGAAAAEATQRGTVRPADPVDQTEQHFFLPLPEGGVVTGRTVSLLLLAIGLFLIVLVLLRLPYPWANAVTDAEAVGVQEQPVSLSSGVRSQRPSETHQGPDDDLIDAITSRAVSKLRSGSGVQPTPSE